MCDDETFKWLPWKCDAFGSKTKKVKDYTKEEARLSWSLITISFTVFILYTIYFVNTKNHTELIYEKGIDLKGFENFCNKDMHYTGCRCMHNSSTIFDCDLKHAPKCSEYICHGWTKLEVYHIIFNYFSNMGGMLGSIMSLHVGIYLFFKNKYLNKIEDIVNKIEDIYEIDEEQGKDSKKLSINK